MSRFSPGSIRFFEACGRRGGQVRAGRLSSFKRSVIAAQAASARWGRSRPASGGMNSVRLNEPRFADPVYIGEVLEEGSLTDWREIYLRVADRPFGPTAHALERVLSHGETYGVTPLWKGILRTVRGAYP